MTVKGVDFLKQQAGKQTWAIMISIISIAIAAWEQVWSFINKAIVYLETLSST